LLFVTTVNCMDGRVQLPVINYLCERFDVPYVDSITEAGPVRVLAEEGELPEKASILRRVDISVRKHGSKVIAVAAHGDCTGNPADDETQREQLETSVALIAGSFPGTKVLGLWLDAEWSVRELLHAGQRINAKGESCDGATST